MFYEYFQNQLSVIPIRKGHKAPTRAGWEAYCDRLPMEDEIDFWQIDFDNGKTGIGVCCGMASNLTVIDVDVDDDGIMDIINRHADTPVRRRGEKGLALFYQHNPNIRSQVLYDGNRNKVIDILAKGRQVVLPPSIHPNGNKYVWVTPDTLSNMKTEKLPVLSDEVFNKISTQISHYMPSKGQANASQGHPVIIGRNDKLKSFVGAAYGKGKTVDVIAMEIYEFDKNMHSPRLFTDSKEGYRSAGESDALFNARKFTRSIIRSIDKRVSPDGTLAEESVAEKILSIAPAPLPNGGRVLEQLTDYILETSRYACPLMAKGAAMSILGVLASKLGAKMHSPDGILYPHLYTIILAESGDGKGAPGRAVKDICQHFGLLGSGDYKSDAGLFTSFFKLRKADGNKQWLEPDTSKFVRLDMLDESDILFDMINSSTNLPYMKGISNYLCKLYTIKDGEFTEHSRYSKRTPSTQATEIRHEDEQGNRLIGLKLNFLGFGTIKSFSTALSRRNLYSGLAQRCNFIISPGGEYQRGFERRPLPDIRPVIESLDELFGEWAKGPKETEMRPSLDMAAPDIFDSDEVNEERARKEAVWDDIEELEIHYKYLSKRDDGRENCYTRAGEQIKKYAMINAFSDGRREVRCEDLEFAEDLFKSLTQNNMEFFESIGATPREVECGELLKRIVRFAKKSGSKGIAYISDVRAKSKRLIENGKYDSTIRALMDVGSITLDETSKAYRVADTSLLKK